MKSKRSGKFMLRQVGASSNGFTYDTFLLSGWLNGRRARKHFKSRDEALGEKNSLEIEAANSGGEIRARNTRLSAEQIAEAELAMARLGPKSLSLAVEWLLATYKPPVTAIAIEAAVDAFLEAKAPHIRPLALRDFYTCQKILEQCHQIWYQATSNAHCPNRPRRQEALWSQIAACRPSASAGGL
jgi:hypothetical protein